MVSYDLTDFLQTPRQKRTLEQVVAAADAMSAGLNALIVASYDNPAIKDAEARFGLAQMELSKLTRELSQ